MKNNILEDELYGIYQQINEIAETFLISDDTSPNELFFDEIQSLYNKISLRENQIKTLIDLANCLYAKTKEKMSQKMIEISVLAHEKSNLDSEIKCNKENINELEENMKKLTIQKNKLEEFLSDLEGEYEQNQGNLMISRQECETLAEYKLRYHELNSRREPNNELLAFYKNNNEDIKHEILENKKEILLLDEEIRNYKDKVTSIADLYEHLMKERVKNAGKKADLESKLEDIKKELEIYQENKRKIENEIEIEQKKRVKNLVRINSKTEINDFENISPPKNIDNKEINEINNNNTNTIERKSSIMSIELKMNTEENEKIILKISEKKKLERKKKHIKRIKAISIPTNLKITKKSLILAGLILFLPLGFLLYKKQNLLKH